MVNSLHPQIHSVWNRGVLRRPLLSRAKNRSQILLLITTLSVLFAVSATLILAPAIRGDEKPSSDPWTSAQVLQPSDLAHELGDKHETPPTIVYVGFHTLFAGGHIPGASFHGSASTEQGLAELKKWADTLPRSTNLVIYCGCCPFDKCPNMRPAFTALSNMGFKKLRVLVLPTNFATDWAGKGYPIQKGM
jgi:thiosulfate/3-mercaptopyruvate sulfurtransferase